MKPLFKTVAIAAGTLALSSAPAAAAPDAPGKAQCIVFGTPLSGGACVKYERTGQLNGSAFTQNCRQIVQSYPFTFYPGGVPFPPTTVKNLGECKAALKFFHSSFPG